MLVISLFYLVRYSMDSDLIYSVFEIFNIIVLLSATLLLLKGRKDSAAVLLFPVFGNIYLIRIIIMAVFIPYDGYPFTIEIYYSFQIMIILAAAYFCRKRLYIWITAASAFCCSCLFLFYRAELMFSSALLSKIMFIIIPTLFALHINRSRSLLEDYYRVNITKNREINHRVKNHLSILKSMIKMRPDYESGNSEQLRRELNDTITVFLKIYDRLLYSENIHSLNLKHYISSLIEEYSNSLKVDFRLEINDPALCIAADKAAHIGMILTELIINSNKHASVDKLLVSIGIRAEDGRIVVSYDDNGGAFRASRSAERESFGRNIIRSIVVDTLKGEIRETSGYGIECLLPLEALKASPV